MARTVVVEEAVSEEAEAQILYYVERAGTVVALRIVAEIEAIYDGLGSGRFVGVNHPRARFRLPIKRVFLDRFPFAVVFYVEHETVYVVALDRADERDERRLATTVSDDGQKGRGKNVTRFATKLCSSSGLERVRAEGLEP